MFKTKWRIVRDDYLGYEVQSKKWWWPCFFQYGVNTSSTLERAMERLRQYQDYQRVVWEE